MSNFLRLLTLLVLVALSSCHRRLAPLRPVTKPSATAVPTAAVKASNLTFRYFSAKARAQLDVPNLKQTVNLNIRIRQDSIIWLSISVAGFEVARAHITPDSVRVINKLQREYYGGNFSYLKERFNVDVTFAQLQALLLGNYLPPPADATPTITVEGPDQRVAYAQSGLAVQQLLSLAQGRVEQLAVRDPKTQNQYTVDYADFRPVEDVTVSFAYTTQLRVQQAQNTSTVGLSYRNVDVDKEQLTFPFSVPSGYAQKK